MTVPDSRSANPEVVVVGAGPAGSAAAATLARQGHEVLLLEAGRFPRDKVCGDVLLPEVSCLLERMGTSLDEIAPDALMVYGCRYTSAGGRQVQGGFCDAQARVHPWRVLQRKVLDERLARHAVSCGARLKESHRLVSLTWLPGARKNRLLVKTPSGELVLEASIVIGADGATSQVARSRGLMRSAATRAGHLAVAVRAYVDRAPEPYLEVFATKQILPGCGWIVPVPGGRANVGLGVMAPRKLPLRAELERILGSRVALERIRSVGWQLPYGGPERTAVADGLLLVGDAAGFIDPFTGHGIHHALRSGIAAAEAAGAALETGELGAGGSALAGYERRWRALMGGELRWGRRLQRVHRRASLVEMAIARAARSPRWADRFMGLVGHAVPRAELLRPSFLWDALRPSGRWPTAPLTSRSVKKDRHPHPGPVPEGERD